MAFSQNGWAVLDVAPPTVTIPGTNVRVRVRPGDVATVLCYVATRFDNEVEDLDTANHPADRRPGIAGDGPSAVDDDWGWAVRTIRGSSTVISNHASGTAMDLNATQHPRGVHGTYTAEQKRRMHVILADPLLGGVVRWGEDYSSASTIDGMHIEINDGERSVAQAAARIRAAQTTPEEDMPLNAADEAKIASIVDARLAAATPSLARAVLAAVITTGWQEDGTYSEDPARRQTVPVGKVLATLRGKLLQLARSAGLPPN